MAIRAAELEVKVGADTRDADTKLESVSRALGSTAKAATVAFAAAGVGVAAGLGMAISSAAGFEQRLSGIGAVSGATAAEMDQMSAKALQLGKDTSFSASEAAAGIEELIKGGVSIPDVMNGAADATLALAAAGGVSLPEAATIAANALAQFNLGGQDMAKVADLIAGAANASAIDVGQFKLSLQAAGAVANTIGFSFDDLATAIALMGKAGIAGSDAGTSLKTMMLSLQPTTDKQVGLMKELGLLTASGANAFFDASGKVKSFGEVSQILQTSMAHLTQQQRLQAMETLFGTDAIRAAAVMSEAGAAGFREMAGDMGKVTAQAVGMQRLNNLSGDFEQLKGSVETAAIIFGRMLQPAMRQVTQGATSLVNSLLPMIETMGPKIIASVGATLARLTTFFGSLTEGTTLATAVNRAFGDMIPFGLNTVLDTVDRAFSAVKNTVMTVITAVSEGGLAGAWNLLAGSMSAFAPTGERIERLINAIRQAVTPLIQRGLEFVASMAQQQTAGASLGDQFMTLANVVNTVSGAIEGVVNWFSQSTAATSVLMGVLGGLATAWTVAQVATTAMSAALTIKTTALAAATAAQWLLNAALTANPIGIVVVALGALAAALVYAYNNSEEFRAVVDAAFQVVGTVVANVLTQAQAIIRMFGETLAWAGTATDQWREVIASNFDLVMGAVRAATDTVVAVIRTAWGAVQSATTVAWTAIYGHVQAQVNLVRSIIDTTTAIITAIFRVWHTSLRLMTQAFWDYFGEYITDAWNDVSDLVTRTTEAIYSKVNQEWTNVRTITTSIYSGIQSFLSTTWNTIKTTIIDPAMEGIKTAITTAWGAIDLATTTTWNAIKGYLTTIWDASSGIRYVISSAVDSASTTLSTAWESIRSTAETKWNAVKTLVSTAWGGAGGIKPTVETDSSSVKNTLEVSFESIRSTAETKWSATKTLITNAISEAKRIASLDQGTLESELKTSFEAVRASAVDKWGAITRAIDISAAVSNVSGWVAGIKGHFTGMVEPIESAVRGLTNNINSWFDGAKRKAEDIRNVISGWKSQVEGWLKIIQDAWNTAKRLVESFPRVPGTSAPAASAPASSGGNRAVQDTMALASAPASMRGASVVNYITIQVPTVGIADNYRLAQDIATALKPHLDNLGATQVMVSA